MDKQKIEELKFFVTACKSNPAVLHLPALQFFRDWLISLGATIPEVPAPKKEETKPEKPKPAPIPEPASTPAATPVVEEEEAVIADEPGESNLVDEGDVAPCTENKDKAVSEEEEETARAAFSEAREAASEGNLEKAIEKYNASVNSDPRSARVYAMRANAHIKLRKPKAAIRDANAALARNPDSAPALKWRGKAYMMLGQWANANKDLAAANTIDFDEDCTEWLKEVKPKALRAIEKERQQARIRDARELKERAERRRAAQEQYERDQAAAQSGGGDDDDDMSGMGGGAGMGGMEDIMAAFKDPEIMAAFQDIQTNPGNISKYTGNPKIMSFLMKMQGAMKGMPGMGGMFGGGAPASGGMGGQAPPPARPYAAPTSDDVD